MVDFPIRVIIDPTQSVRGVDSVGRRLRTLESIATQVGPRIQRAISVDANRAAAGVDAVGRNLRSLEAIAVRVGQNIQRSVSIDPARAGAGAKAVVDQLGGIGAAADRTKVRVDRVTESARALANLRLRSIEEFDQLANTASRIGITPQQRSSIRAAQSGFRALGAETERDVSLLIQMQRQGDRSFGALDRGARGSTNNLRLLGGAIGSTFAIGGIVRIGREFQNLERRIASVSDGTRDTVRNIGLIEDVSDETGTAVASNAAAFARLSIATRQLGIGSERTVGIVRTLNQALVVGGASSQEASSAITQLGQGLASGRLQGDELRSILESAPLLAETIARQLGVTIGQLRQLGAEGKLTSDRLVSALEGSADEIDARFRQLGPSLDQSVTRLQNAFVGLGEALQPGVEALSDAVTALTGVVSAVERIGTVGARASGGPSSEDRLRTEATRLGRTTGLVSPGAREDEELSALVTRLRGLELSATDVRQLFDQLNQSGQLNQAGAAAIETILQARQRALSVVQSGALERAQSQLEDENFSREVGALLTESTENQVRSLTDALVRLGEGQVNQLGGLARELANRQEAIARDLSGLVDRGAFSATDFGALGSRTAADVAGLQGQGVGDLQAGLQRADEAARITDLEGQLSEVFSRIESVRQSFGAGQTPANERGDRTIDVAQRGAGDDVIAALREEQALLQLTNAERSLAIALKKAEKDAGQPLLEGQRTLIAQTLQENEILREKNDILDRVSGATENAALQNLALKAAADELGLSIEELRLKLLMAGEIAPMTFGEGFRNSLNQAKLSVADLGAAVGDQLVGTLNQASGILAEFALGGARDVDSLRESFSQLFADLAKQLLQKAIFSLLIGGASGGANLLSGLGSAGAAEGRARPAGQRIGVGGRGTELFVPSTNVAAASVNAITRSRRFSSSIAREGLRGRQGGGSAQPGEAFLVGENGPSVGTFGQTGTVVPSGLLAGLVGNSSRSGGGGGQPMVIQAPAPVVEVNVTNVDNAEDTVRKGIRTPGVRAEILNMIREERDTIERI